MLTSFFSKSKPVTFLLVMIFMSVFYVTANIGEVFFPFDLGALLTKLGVFVFYLLSILVLNFIAKKNELTRRSAFKIIIFAALSVSFPTILKNDEVIIASFFVLLALRRVISLRSHRDVRQKIFDGAFWICIASLFYFWAILFIFVVYAGVMVHAASQFKNWLVPPVAIFVVLTIVTGFQIILTGEFYTFPHWYEESSFDFAAYNRPGLLFPLSVILALALWTLFYYLGLLQRASISSRPTYILVLFTFLISIGVAVFSPEKNGSELLFFLVPLSLIVSNYFESKREKTFKEILLAGIILMPVLIPILF